jgi:hypothetical protein
MHPVPVHDIATGMDPWDIVQQYIQGPVPQIIRDESLCLCAQQTQQQADCRLRDRGARPWREIRLQQLGSQLRRRIEIFTSEPGRQSVRLRLPRVCASDNLSQDPCLSLVEGVSVLDAVGTRA